MGIQTIKSSKTINMKAFVAISALLAIAAADQSSHATIQHGHGPVVSHAIHKAHGAHHALVSKTAVHPVHVAHHAPLIHHAPLVHHAPVVVAHAAPVIAHPAPYHAPAPAPYHAPAPAYHKPAPYHEPEFAAPVYGYEYAVVDDYRKATFAQNEARDGYKTSGSYRVALPDGRTQVVTYRVDDATSGYVADVAYEGVAAYPEAKAYHPAPPPYHPAPVVKAVAPAY